MDFSLIGLLFDSLMWNVVILNSPLAGADF